jgi:hypothetical protein
MKTKLFLGLFLISLCSFGQIVTIPDAKFKAKLVQANASNSVARDLNGNYFKIDANDDGEIEISEAEQVSGLTIFSENIASLEGISSFKNLKILHSGSNQLTNLDLTKNTALESLDCTYNLLTSLNLSKNTALVYLGCFGNKLTNLDISESINLQDLDCSNNQLTNLNVSKSIALENFICIGNKLTTLDVSENTNLIYLYCNNNQLTNLDISKNTVLENLNCKDNKLVNLNLKNGNNKILDFGDFKNNPYLTCIKVDDVLYSNTYWKRFKDAKATYNVNCGSSKRFSDSDITNNIDLQDEVFAYPNPTSGNLEITLPASNKKANISIYSSGGSLISNKTYDIQNGKAQLSLENEGSGAYMIKIEGFSNQIKIIKK